MDDPDSQAVAAIHALSNDVGHIPAKRATTAFLELLPARLQGCRDGDAQVAHTLAGAAHMLGLTELATQARALEIALEAPTQAPAAEEAVTALVAVAKRDATVLAGYLGTAAPPIL